MQWLPVDVRVEQLYLHIMHRIFHGGEIFGMVSQVHDIKTRYTMLFVFLPPTRENGLKAFKFNGIKSQNELPLNKKN